MSITILGYEIKMMGGGDSPVSVLREFIKNYTAEEFCELCHEHESLKAIANLYTLP